MAFNRKMELFIGVFKDAAKKLIGTDAKAEQEGYLIDGLDYDFDITRSTEYYKDTATFTIYNPNAQTMQEIMTAGCAVIFRAGFSDEDMGTIFVGQVALAYPEIEEPETTKLVLICKSQRGAQYPLQRVFITALVERGKSLYDVLKIIADYAGVALSGAEPLKARKLERSYMIDGDIRSAIENICKRKLRALGGDLIVSNNELIYYEKGKIDFATVYLNYSSGLIKAIACRNETYQSSEDAFEENREYYLGLANSGDPEVAKQKAQQAKVQPKNEVNFECLMTPGLHVLTPVYIDARKSGKDDLSVFGKFYVTELHYVGGNYAGSQYNINGKAWEYNIGAKDVKN